jgi:hypothetical protein
MKTITRRTLAAGIVAGMLLFAGCTKEGPIGPQGQPGLNGVANIQTSFVTVKSTDWSYDQTSNLWYSDFGGFGTISNNAAVLVYYVDNTNTNVSLPVTFSDIQYYYSNGFSNGSSFIEVDVSSASGATTVANPGTTNYKIVVIPPAFILKNVNTGNYAEVKAAYGLKD